MTVRELITKIGFKVDKKGIEKGKRLIEGFKKVAKVAVLGIVAGIAAIGIASIKSAADMEMLTTQFEVMLGSTEKANAMMEKLETFSAATPFQLPDLAQGTQNLLAFGVAEDDVIKTMRMLGDTAMGNSEKLKGLVLAYGKVQVKGKASMEELNMIAEKGIPIYTVLMKQIGVQSKEAFFKMVSSGKIGKEAITQAFQTMTSEGGIFFKGMLKSSKTFTGVMSTLKDVLGLVAAGIGKTMLPLLKKFAIRITAIAMKVREWVKLNKEKLENSFKKLAQVLMGVMKVLFAFGKILFWIAKSPIGAMILGIVVALKTYSIVMGIVNAIQAIWNALLIANPIGLIITAIGALIGIIIYLILNWGKVTKFFKKTWKSIVGFFERAIEKIKQFFITLWEVIKRNANFLVIFAPFIGVPVLIIKKWKKIISFFKNFKSNIIKIWRTITKAIIFAFNHPIEAIKKAWENMKNFFQDIIDGIVSGFKKIFGLGKDKDEDEKVKARLATTDPSKDMKQGAEKTSVGGAKTINAEMNNKIEVKVEGGVGGASPESIGRAVGSAVQSRFGLELKKVLISAV